MSIVGILYATISYCFALKTENVNIANALLSSLVSFACVYAQQQSLPNLLLFMIFLPIPMCVGMWCNKVV